MKTKYFILLIFIAIATQVGAQNTTPKDRHYIDFGIGKDLASGGSSAETMGGTMLGGKDKTTSFYMRYQLFFNKKWGAFISMNIYGSSEYEFSDLPRFTKPDYSKYYRLYGGYDGYADISNYLLGAQYRFDSRWWSIRPYLGAGVSTYYFDGNQELCLKEKGGNGVFYSKMSLEGNDTHFCLSPGIYVAFKLSRGFHLFAEASYVHNFGTFKSLYTFSDGYTDEILEEKREKISPRNPLTGKIGISFPIWFNKK